MWGLDVGTKAVNPFTYIHTVCFEIFSTSQKVLDVFMLGVTVDSL